MDYTKNSDLNDLVNERTMIENKISEMAEILNRNGVGMEEELVDREGYPRNDINVYEVRVARAAIIALKNDFKRINMEIELMVQNRIPRNPSGQPVEQTAPLVAPNGDMSRWSRPLGKLNKIIKGSPADTVGLLNGDILVQFGNIDGTNYKGLTHLAAIINENENLYIKVVVQRDDVYKRVNLKPCKWAGNGLLGCLLEPV